MAATQLNIQPQSFQSPIQLEEPYSLDKWPVKDWNIYKDATTGNKEYYNNYGFEDGALDFSSFKQEAARTEFKYFLYTCVASNCTLRTVTEHFARGRHLSAYLEEHPSIESILDINEDDYVKFLLKTGRINSARIGDGQRINGDMEISAVRRKNRTINLLLHVQGIIKEIYEEDIPEQTKDYWQLKKFPFLNKDTIYDWKNLNFTRIPQKGIKEITKRMFYAKLKIANPLTLYNNLQSISFFLEWLGKEYPKISDLNQLDRPVIENYFEYLRTSSGCSSARINRHILATKKYLEDGYLFDSEHFPEMNLILNTDYRIKPLRNASFYSDSEIRNINAALPKLPVMYASIVLCLELLALRISDLITLTPSMIEETVNDPTCTHHIKVVSRLAKTQQKTNKYVFIPLSSHVHKILLNQIRISKEQYGDDVKYVFATGKNTHIGQTAVSNTINYHFYKNEVRSDSGDILRFKSHKFRATKATKLIEKGFGATEAARALGHGALQSLSYYATVTDDTLIDNLDPYLAKVQTVIENMGNGVEKITESTEKLLPLCNGWCCRPASLGVCEHANKCLSCTLFKPDSRHINYYKLQLQELEATLGIAEATNNTSLVSKVKEDIAGVKRIIEEVEKLCKQKGM